MHICKVKGIRLQKPSPKEIATSCAGAPIPMAAIATMMTPSRVMVGRVWYEAEYAIYLETNPDWKPRKKKTAKPHFLRSGFEDEGPQSEIKEIIRNGYKL